MDILVPYIPIELQGYKYIWVIEIFFSRYCMFIPLRTISTKKVADAFIIKNIANLAIPNFILSDLGQEIKYNISKEIFSS